MNEKMLESLQRALEDIRNMSEEELFSDFGTPESEYYFTDLAFAEKVFYGKNDPESCRDPEDELVCFQFSSQSKLNVYNKFAANIQDDDYLWAA